MLKNVMIVDGAKNCVFDIFAIEEEHFRRVFPGDGQNIEFADDFVARVGEDEALAVCSRLWKRPMKKSEVTGIHGILYYELDYKKQFYPQKIDEEAVNPNGSKLRGHDFIWSI